VRAVFEEITSGKFASGTGVEARGEARSGNRINDEANARLLYSLGKGEKPTAEQTAEAKRQYEEVENLYKDTGAWLKAPNGADTKLNTRQWIQVRTPLFKKYFGDWEAAAMSEFYENGVSYEEVKTRLLSFLENGKPTLLYNSNTADSINFSKSSIGKLLSEEAVRKSVTNGFSRKQHYAVVSDIKRLFYDSIKLIERPDKNNDPNVKIIRFGRPVIIGGKTRLVFITVKESAQHGEHLYSAELIELKKLEGNLEEVDATHFPTSSKEKLNEFFNSVNPSDVSVVRDNETGEPLVVWHGSVEHGFDVFKTDASHNNNSMRDTPGAWFTDRKTSAVLFADWDENNIYEVFCILRRNIPIV
jgi:hypothetical protein